MSDNLPDWSELEAQFGTDAIGVVDKAVSTFLSNRSKHGDVKRDEMYLVSEGVTYSVILAMRDAGLRFTPAVRSIAS